MTSEYPFIFIKLVGLLKKLVCRENFQNSVNVDCFLQSWTASERFIFFSFVIFVEILLVNFPAFVPVRPDILRRRISIFVVIGQ